MMDFRETIILSSAISYDAKAILENCINEENKRLQKDKYIFFSLFWSNIW